VFKNQTNELQTKKKAEQYWKDTKGAVRRRVTKKSNICASMMYSSRFRIKEKESVNAESVNKRYISI